MIEQSPYPTRGGLPIHPDELEMPTVYTRGRENNHHLCYNSKTMGRLILTQTLRDLEAYQSRMLVEQHDLLHSRYDEPIINLQSAYDRVHEAYDDGEKLRRGSLNKYELIELDTKRMMAIDDEWRERLQ